MKVATRRKKIAVLEAENVKLWNRYMKMFPQEHNLSDVDLRVVNLSGVDLTNINFYGADLRSTNFRNADFRGANLRNADLRSADIRCADFRDVDLNFSTLPLWCGGQDAKIDSRLAKQFLLHALAFECEDKEYQAIRDFAKEYLKDSHIAHHINWIKE